MGFAHLLVDLAAVASASRAVASKHVALRARQVERYSRGSDVVGAVLGRRQTQGREPARAREGQQQAQSPEPAATAEQQQQQQQPRQEAEAGAGSGQGAEGERAAGGPGLRVDETPVARPDAETSSVSATGSEGKVETRGQEGGIGQAAEGRRGEARQASGGSSEFKPAPWADGGIALLKQGFVPPKRPPQLLKKPAVGIPGIDLSHFRTKEGSQILEVLKEMEEKEEDEVRKPAASVDATSGSLAENARGTEDHEGRREQEVTAPPTPHPERVSPPAPEQAAGNPATIDEVPEENGKAPESPFQVDPAKSQAETTGHGARSAEEAPASWAPEAAEKKPPSQEDASIISDLAKPNPLSSGAAAAYQLRESAVPSTRIGRLWNYGGLAAGMFAGAIGEGLSRAIGGGGSGPVMLNAANMERLVAKLSRMRGAALKLGQMMSFQDAKMLPAPIQEVLQRVQDRADYMPGWQRDRVLAANLGENWRDLFREFEDKPIAAASIGQVHRATLKSSGARVAVKIQFPGVADSINSDLDNLAILLAATKLLPKGLYLDKTIDNARTELAWECDYTREAECAERYRDLLLTRPSSSSSSSSPSTEESVFSVPRVYREASGPHVLTMEFMDGTAVTRIASFTQAQRDWIGTQILRLCLREITEFRFMQTDPNWTNFLYNAGTGKLELLDFGASREYPERFVTLYVRLLEAASRADRAAVKDLSEQLGYLTGHESRAMLDAHVTSVLTLAEPFLRDAPDVYDFRDQTITERVKAQIPVMIRERLAPPPEETYSLHRKLSGAFLLCARLGSRVRCRELFEEALAKTGYIQI
ncbi:ABC1-domain-containing protein [Thermothelomyces heterothallicus CBS 203.75]